ncbi:hypothetical protein JCM9279_000317 [Rhodotorula babjevae]
MVSAGLALAACIVPPVCVLVVAVWTAAIYWRLKRLAGQQKGPPAPPPAARASALETVELPPPSHPVSLLASHLPPPRSTLDAHPPFSSTPTTSILRTDLFASLPSPRPPPPPEPRFSIRTTFARDGSRVLARQTTSSAGHGGGQGQDEGGAERPMRPARTRRDRGQFGIGSGDDERWELVQGGGAAPLDMDDRAGPVVIVDGDATVTPRRRAGLTRRSSTWSARDFEGVLLRASSSPHRSPSHSIPSHVHAASLSPSRPGARPLPPGARHESSRTSADGDGATSSEASGEALTTPLSSQESGGPLLGRQRRAEGRQEWAEQQWGGQVEYVSTGAPTSSTSGAGVEPLSTTAHARTPSDISSSNSFFFGTTTAPLPPGSASGSSAGHGQRRQSTWSTSTYEAVFTDFPSRSTRPLRPSIVYQQRSPPPRPAPVDVRSLPERRGSRAGIAGPPALTHSATSPAALEPYSQRAVGAPTRSTTFHSRADHAQERPTSPWFTGPSLAHTPHPPPPLPSHDWLPSAHLERLDARRERSAILAARRPVSWLGRQGSNGSLPESVPAFGNLEIVNPDAETLNTPAVSPALAL